MISNEHLSEPEDALEPRTGADWVARMHSGRMNRADQRAVREWMDRSDERAHELLRAEAIWRLTGALGAAPEVKAELSEARAAERERTARRRVRLWKLAAACALLLPAAVLPVLWWAHAPGAYETSPGEQRNVTLPDGSWIALNTNTRLSVNYAGIERAVTLQRGEALFQVMPNPRRPFVVRAGSGSVRAVGTRFNVLVEGPDVTVAVLEGKVEVAAVAAVPASEANVPAQRAVLNAGQATAYEKTGKLVKPEAKQASADRIVAWREGKLRFVDWPVERAIREHNRYASKPILFDAALGEQHISGVFRIGDTGALLSALSNLFSMEVVDDGDTLHLVPMPPERAVEDSTDETTEGGDQAAQMPASP